MTRMESHDNDQHDTVDEDDDGDAQVMMIMMLNMIRILLPILVLDARMTMPTSDRIQRCSCTARCSRCYNQGTTLPVRCCFILRDCRVTLDCRACGRCRSIWGIGRAGGVSAGRVREVMGITCGVTETDLAHFNRNARDSQGLGRRLLCSQSRGPKTRPRQTGQAGQRCLLHPIKHFTNPDRAYSMLAPV